MLNQTRADDDNDEDGRTVISFNAFDAVPSLSLSPPASQFESGRGNYGLGGETF